MLWPKNVLPWAWHDHKATQAQACLWFVPCSDFGVRFTLKKKSDASSVQIQQYSLVCGCHACLESDDLGFSFPQRNVPHVVWKADILCNILQIVFREERLRLLKWRMKQFKSVLTVLDQGRENVFALFENIPASLSLSWHRLLLWNRI